MKWPVLHGWQRLLLALVIIATTPLVVTWARASLTPAAPAVVAPAPLELLQLGEPEALSRRYGLAIVAMREPPSASIADAVPAAANEGSDATGVATYHAPGVLEASFRAPPAPFSCPEVRAIISGDETFAIIAWGDASFVAKSGQSLMTPVGDVSVKRVRPRSLTLASGDVTLQCNLLVR